MDKSLGHICSLIALLHQNKASLLEIQTTVEKKILETDQHITFWEKHYQEEKDG